MPDTLRAVSERTYDCPQCGAPVKFGSSITVFAVCAFCQSMVVRKDVAVERLGKMAELPPDLSPLQIGTRGEWEGQAFEIIGRVRVGWKLGSWTEWCALFPDQQIGWVAEAQGFFMVTRQASGLDEIPRGHHNYSPGTAVKLGKTSFKVVDVKRVECIAGEGELPFVAEPGTRRINADLAGKKGEFGTIEFGSDEPEVFLGRYADFAELRFTNLRPVPGWSTEAPQIKHTTAALNCPSCGAAVELRAAGQTQAAVCGSCGTLVDTANPQLEILQSSNKAISAAMAKMELPVEIGRRGHLFGTEWEVIGAQLRKDEYVAWTECLLFNPYAGFRWLVYYRGHWSFVKPLLAIPDVVGQVAKLERQKFKLFARGNARVEVVLGEFYWKVQRGEIAGVWDYVRPPAILSLEKYPGLAEETWSLGEYVEPRVVEQAFGIKGVSWRSGIYLNQPNPWSQRWSNVDGPLLLAVSLYVVIQIGFAMTGERKPVWSGDFLFSRSSPEKVAVSPYFELKGGQQPVSITVRAPVENNWISLDIDLVDAATNAEMPVEIGVEKYSGREDGEAWTEGGQVTTVTLPAVPAGEYFLNIEPDADPAISRMKYRVEVRPGGLFWSNFWVGLGFLLAYPLFLLWRRHSWEVERWSESNYSPYASSSSD